ncbi:MAG: GNAT family N-acetyltransferase [Promethearchaeota archaeon]
MELLKKILNKKEFRNSPILKSYTVKKYDNSDFRDLMVLYEKVFPQYMSKDLWLWKFKQNPFGEFFTFLIKDKNKVISAYNVIAKEFNLYGVKIYCVQSLDTMTDPDYRGLGLFPFLGNLTYEYIKQKEYCFVYGFPNHIIYKLREIKLGWTNLGQLHLFSKNLTSKIEYFNFVNNNFTIKEISRFDKDINDFWNNCKSNYSIIITKDRDYLNWRFCNHPKVNYKKYLILDNETNKIVSYFVLKKYEDKIGNFLGHIVDFLIGPQSKSLKKEIFNLIEKFSSMIFKEECSKLTFWMPDNDLKNFILNELGYTINKMNTYFGYKILKNQKQLSNLRSLKNWYITMANNDVF